jgi:hypothetical protein
MKNILFVTAQPDVPYFIWQIKLYVNNFIEKGIDPNQIHVVFSIINRNGSPSEESLKLKDFGINVHHFSDFRRKKHYIPSIKPYLISSWLKTNSDYSKLFFLHDADIIFKDLPNFDKLLNDDICYLSDTIGYIGYDYIIDCCGRYEIQHPKSEKNQLINEMANVIGLDVEVIKENRKNAGGGQYLIKNTDADLWDKIYRESTLLYDQMLDYQKRFPISPGEIQFWTAEMWSLLWNLWLDGHKTEITKELDFSWATDSIEIYEKRPILHMAGVTEDMKNRKFYKGEFINIDPIQKLKEDPNFFDFVENTSSTVKYIDNMKSYIKKYES